ncbi:MAG: TonB-dependent receptor [Sphingosinicella sp.]|nr:TonB-dependent receptor [Sphingosinicella sp.]
MKNFVCRTVPAGILLSAVAFGPEAHAQRANENAIRSAEDAFGTSIGRESIGLYGPSSVRGFSPITAGNVRLDGLYLDAVVVPNPRLFRSSTVRVGISAQGYPFSAPTGIADFRLRLPGDEAVMSAILGGASNGSVNGEVDLQLPLIGKSLAFAGGVGASHDEMVAGGTAMHGTVAAMLRWRPAPEVEIIPFWSKLVHRDEDFVPRVVTAGGFLPPKIKRGIFFSQPWIQFEADDINYGILGRYSAGPLAVSAGLFRSVQEPQESFSDLFLNTSREGVSARHRIVASPDQKIASTSAELRVSRELTEGDRRHILHLTARAREQSRLYGGAVSFDFGPARIGEPVSIPEVSPIFGPRSQDDIRQFSAGAGYEGRWRDVGELTLSLTKTEYRKEVERPGLAEPVTVARPWLFGAALAVHASPSLALYGGFTRGLEESGIAPDTAVNRNEASPALLTRQYDGGLRWAITPKLRLVSGLFTVEKPYFNLDAANVYRRLGEVRHRGAELSLVGEITPNLNIVAGAILLDAKVRGEAVSGGLIGARPVGTPDKTILLTAEYRPPSLKGLALDVSATFNGERAANVANSFFVEPSDTYSAGVRYRWTLGRLPVTARAQLMNLFNSYDWQLQGPNTYAYNAPRHLSFRLMADF